MDVPMEMQNQVMGYDRAATMFSPDGHLLQVEYAEKTVRLGSASIGFSCKDGIVIIADKRTRDKLIVNESANKIQEVDDHIIASAAGILSDSRILIEKAQLLAQQHQVTYDSGIDVESIIKEISDLKQAFTQYGGARPFGVSIMVAGLSGAKSKLFVSDVTGNYYEYKASAIGENDERIREMLREENFDLTIDDAIKLGFKIFKKLLAKNFETSRFDVCYITIKDKKLVRLDEEEIKKYVR
ncbi:MAG: archaeal proteasome endopeptidase complex subunit alpha [Candidatus Pacearchaeota archaeon]|nr:archaeal proteasome endopeptidase complex subunit alpha [Candidatus Pacearchaeota archaeon]